VPTNHVRLAVLDVVARLVPVIILALLCDRDLHSARVKRLGLREVTEVESNFLLDETARVVD